MNHSGFCSSLRIVLPIDSNENLTQRIQELRAFLFQQTNVLPSNLLPPIIPCVNSLKRYVDSHPDDLEVLTGLFEEHVSRVI